MKKKEMAGHLDVLSLLATRSRVVVTGRGAKLPEGLGDGIAAGAAAALAYASGIVSGDLEPLEPGEAMARMAEVASMAAVGGEE